MVGLVPNMKDGSGQTQAIAYLPLTWRDFSLPHAEASQLLRSRLFG